MESSPFITTPVSELIQKRYSCRTYQLRPLKPNHLSGLAGFIDRYRKGPFNNEIRGLITAAAEDDTSALKNLGTYGFIKDPAGFLIGVVTDAPRALEDFGYLFETYILKATELGIGSCWLGGTFTKSRFAQAADLSKEESIPSVVSLGYPADQQAWIDRLSRIYAGADRRLPWSDLFFDASLDKPLSKPEAGKYESILEMVRLAPSASNKQPWRIIKSGNQWHFFLKRTRRYPPPVFNVLLGLADLQRIDMGIAMAHFELTAREKGLNGAWLLTQPDLDDEMFDLEFTAAWQEIN